MQIKGMGVQLYDLRLTGFYDCTVVTQLVKTYTPYVFSAAIWGWLGLPSFFDKNFFWLSLFMYGRVE